MNKGLSLRANLLQAVGCELYADITADYGDQIYTFAMGCRFDAHGNLLFTVKEPDTIEGITGKVNADGGALTFDDTALSFPLMADGQLSPVSAPWIVMQSMRGGMITSAGVAGDQIRLIIDDSYADDALTVHLWLEKDETPIQAEIYHNGCCILSVRIANYRLL